MIQRNWNAVSDKSLSKDFANLCGSYGLNVYQVLFRPFRGYYEWPLGNGVIDSARILLKDFSDPNRKLFRLLLTHDMREHMNYCEEFV